MGNAYKTAVVVAAVVTPSTSFHCELVFGEKISRTYLYGKWTDENDCSLSKHTMARIPTAGISVMALKCCPRVCCGFSLWRWTSIEEAFLCVCDRPLREMEIFAHSYDNGGLILSKRRGCFLNVAMEIVASRRPFRRITVACDLLAHKRLPGRFLPL